MVEIVLLVRDIYWANGARYDLRIFIALVV